MALSAIEGRAQQEHPLTRIAFGSCAYQERPQPIWAAVIAYRPELFIFAGDNVYGDVRDGHVVPEERTIQSLRHAYSLATHLPGFRQVKNIFPILAHWDDHDYGQNDGGADFHGKQEAQRIFLEFWKIPPSDPRHSRAGLYHAETHGPPGQRIQIILLDTRYFRSPLKAHGSARRARQEALRAGRRPGQDHAGRRPVGLASPSSCASPPSCA